MMNRERRNALRIGVAFTALCGACKGGDQGSLDAFAGVVDAPADPGHFVVANSYVIGGGCPCGIALEDFSGDGRPDLAVVSYGLSDGNGGAGVTVFLNNGAGTVAPGDRYLTGSGPVAVVAGDLNSDGKIDLAVGNESGGPQGSVSELVNSGNGTFAPAVGLSGGFGRAMAVADVNGDGALDLVVTDPVSNTVNVMLNSGSGFASFARYDVAGPAFAVAIGDLDGDGRPDLAVATGDNTPILSVLINNGDGSFGAQVPYALEQQAGSVAIADLNGDGKQDVVVTTLRDQANVFLNKGNGTLAAYAMYAIGAGFSMQTSIAIADLTGDGAPDLAVATWEVGGTGAVSVLDNNGDGTFAPEILYKNLPSAAAIAIGDLDGDGRPDLAVAGSDSLTILLWAP